MISSVLKVVQGLVKIRNSSGTIIDPATLGEQQAQTTALQIMDDWDESDRAKVNLIAGQAGVQGGAGVVTASTPRVVTAEREKYSAATNNFTIAASATDIARLLGSGSKAVRVTKVVVSGRTTSGSPVAVIIKVLKYSSANTGGTSVATTAVPFSSTYAAATASANHYTANPTVGTLVGNIATRSITFQSAGLLQILEFNFENPIVLTGTSEQLSVNFNATSVTGSSICVNFEWEEV